jgi:hypothetical protein
VFSPFMSFLKGLSDSNSELAVRPALEAIRAALQGTECAVLGLMHLNKKPDLAAVERVLGSVVFVNFVRSVLMAVPEDSDTDTVRLMHAKHNLSPRGRDLFYKPLALNPEDRNSQRVRVDWILPDSNKDVDSAYDRKKGGKPTAGEWLVQYLKTYGRVPKERVVAEGDKAGHTEAALEMAHNKNPRCFSQQEGFQGKAIWWLGPKVE